MIYLVIVESILSVFVFLFLKPNHLANRIIAVWFVINALNFVGFLVPEGLTTYLKIGFIPFLLLNGPIFYFYVLSSIRINFKFKWIHSIHLAPFFLFSFLRLFIYRESISPGFYFGAHMSFRVFIVYASIAASIAGYLVAVFVLLFQHKRNLKNYFSSTSKKITLDWVYFMMTVISVSYIFLFFIPLLGEASMDSEKHIFWFNQFNLALLGFLLLVFGLLQPVIYHDKPVNPEEQKEKQQADKYVKSGLDEVQLETTANIILQYLETDKPFLNPDYNLEQMAQDLNITRQNISQTINEQIGKNFYLLVNEFRVSEFKKLLNDPKLKHLTILGLALDAGFNSKSSFNRIFKEITGTTPSSFKREIES